MSYRWLSLGIALLVVCAWSAVAGAESQRGSSYVFGDSATFTVDALPLQAQVLLDGVFVGTAHDLLSLALPAVPGGHVIEVSANGYLTSFVHVVGIPNWATRVQLQLVPDRH